MSQDPQLRVLLLAANPSDRDPTRVATEQQVIQAAIREQGQKERFDLHLITEAYLDHMVETIASEKPHVVHFSGHGTEDDYLLFVRKDDETSQPVSLQTLRLAFQTLTEQIHVPIQLVVLNACFSIEIARALNTWVPFCIGMNGEIEVRAALAFGRGLYQGIAQGMSIHEAFEFGKLQIALQPKPLANKDQPELIVQASADSGVRLLDWVTQSRPSAKEEAELAGGFLPSLVAQIRTMGRAASKLTDGIEQSLPSAGTDTKLTLSTEDRRALRRLLGELQILSASQRSIPGTIRGYAELRTEQEWQTVKWLIKNIQDALQKVLVQFHDSAWIFTIEEPLLVQQITALLQQRGLVLDELMTMPAPQRSDDLQALAEIADIYEKLINELQRHRDALTKLLLRSET